MSETALAAARSFAFDAPVRGAAPHGSGHIHETFRVETGLADPPRAYVLQRLNTDVFRDPDAVMSNLARVTAHLRARLAQRGADDLERRCLQIVPTRDGRTHATDPAGSVWRAFRFVDDTRSCDAAPGPELAREVARAFGAFLADVSDLPGPPLATTIPNFHDLPRRVADLEEAARSDDAGRAGAASAEIDRALSAHASVAAELRTLGALPVRAVHNDCKINNVLLDERTGEGLCVIDLDTVMDGTVLADFGDLVRTAVCRAPEDEVDLAAIRLECDLFTALAQGYLAGCGAALAPEEIAALPVAGRVAAVENGVRFLTDHLRGDTYFRIHRPGHNLDRARAQLQLQAVLDGQRAWLRAEVERAARGLTRDR